MMRTLLFALTLLVTFTLHAGSPVKKPTLSETARRALDDLFPNRASTLAETDPDLIEVFDNFAFDEVLSQSRLDKKTRLKTIVASTIGSQSLSEYAIMLGAALDAGVTPVEIKEILYQAVPYVGIARAYDFIHATNQVLQKRGVALPLEGQSTTTPETRYEKGLAKQKEIFGDLIDNLYRQSPPDELHILRYLSANCFGDYYTRRGLDSKTREMVTFAILLSMGGCEPQLKGHIRGNAAMGNGRDTLLDVITQCLPYVGYPRTLNALRCLDEVLPAAAVTAPAVSGGFPKGETLTNGNFSGSAWLKMLVDNKACDIAVYNVTFDQGCRNSWHRHAVGQLLLCTAGVGYYQERGRDARRLLPGDVVEIPADTEHWHGAAPDCEFAHIGITPKTSANGVTWLAPVTDEEYAAATTPSKQ